MLKNDNIQVCIISTGRPESPKNKTYQQLSDYYPVHWYLGADDIDYKTPAYQTEHYISHDDNPLVAARNAALTDCKDKYCMMLDDDIKRVRRVGENTRLIEIPLHEAIQHTYELLTDSPLYLAGAAPTANPLNYKQGADIRTQVFIIGSYSMYKPNSGILYDQRFQLKEDYDMTLEHIRRYGGVLRLEYLMPEFTHYTNAGGAVKDRNPRKERIAIRRLQAKWGEAIALNPRRGPLEILLKPRRVK